MSHLLDNPIWQALTSGNKKFASGSKTVKYIKRDVGFFAGMKRNSQKALNELHGLLPAGSKVILFTPKQIIIPATWSIKLEKPLLQMVCKKKRIVVPGLQHIKPLGDKNIPAMLKLTHLTNPGPFLQRTIDFGNYEGIFNGRKLVAMTGQRLHAKNYIEVSAVCTHPNHTGKGYAAKLLQSQLNKIFAKSKNPFLHVYPDNPAVHLYKKMGFTIRKEMMVYFIEKQ